MSITSEWNPKQKRLNEIIRKPGRFDEAQQLFMDMHASAHASGVSGSAKPTLLDALWEGLEESDFAVMPTEKDVTIAWNLWHITRIEDLTVNMLVSEAEQVLDEAWLARLRTRVTDTGNAMTDPEIMDFSRGVDSGMLREYRNAVGARTRAMLAALKAGDMKRKIKAEHLERIRNAGGVLEHPDSVWLLDFWGRKDVAGIILMPVTRHQAVHLNDAFHLKQVIRKRQGARRLDLR